MMKTTGIFALILAAGLCAETAGAYKESERRFLWEEANWKMARAATKADFLDAAGTYGRLLETGVRNGPLFYNFGTALLKAGEYDRAFGMFLRAERYAGADPEIRQNMRIALTRKEGEKEISLPWYRVPLFWHYGTPFSTRMNIAIGAFALFWLALTVRIFGPNRFSRGLLTLTLIVLVLFGSSAVTTLQQEAAAASFAGAAGSGGNRKQVSSPKPRNPGEPAKAEAGSQVRERKGP